MILVAEHSAERSTCLETTGMGRRMAERLDGKEKADTFTAK
jgi:hypothetical protein